MEMQTAAYIDTVRIGDENDVVRIEDRPLVHMIPTWKCEQQPILRRNRYKMKTKGDRIEDRPLVHAIPAWKCEQQPILRRNRYKMKMGMEL